MTKPISIVEFCENELLLNLKLWEKQKEILDQLWSGNYSTWVLALGRRSGKTLMSAVVAIYAATMMDTQYKKCLRNGEPFYIVSVANTIDQARIALQMIKSLVKESPMLKTMITRETSEELWLDNGARFRAMPASGRGGRGLACPLIIFDELGHAIDTEGNAAGRSIYEALEPSMAQFGKLGKILLLSSPWLDSGLFYDLFMQARSGEFPTMGCINLPSWEVNPTLDAEWLAQKEAQDPEVFKREYGAVFSSPMDQFLSNEVIEQSINKLRLELPPIPKYKNKYYLSLDPAKGGIGRDSYTACIVHYEQTKLVLDLWHEFPATYQNGSKKEVSIEAVEQWILERHSEYKFAKIVLDQYNSASTIQRLQNKVAGDNPKAIYLNRHRGSTVIPRGLPIEELTWTSASKKSAYSKMRDLFQSSNIELYDHTTGIKQLKGLKRLFTPRGDWAVVSPEGSSVDDYCACLAAGILIAQEERKNVALPVYARAGSYVKAW